MRVQARCSAAARAHGRVESVAAGHGAQRIINQWAGTQRQHSPKKAPVAYAYQRTDLDSSVGPQLGQLHHVSPTILSATLLISPTYIAVSLHPPYIEAKFATTVPKLAAMTKAGLHALALVVLVLCGTASTWAYPKLWAEENAVCGAHPTGPGECSSSYLTLPHQATSSSTDVCPTPDCKSQLVTTRRPCQTGAPSLARVIAAAAPHAMPTRAAAAAAAAENCGWLPRRVGMHVQGIESARAAPNTEAMPRRAPLCLRSCAHLRAAPPPPRMRPTVGHTPLWATTGLPSLWSRARRAPQSPPSAPGPSTRSRCAAAWSRLSNRSSGALALRCTPAAAPTHTCRASGSALHHWLRDGPHECPYRPLASDTRRKCPGQPSAACVPRARIGRTGAQAHAPP